MNRVNHLLSLSVMIACVLAFSVPANAHNIFKKQLSAAYPNMKVTCNTCHLAKAEFPKAKKTQRNNFGKMFGKVLDSKALTSEWKEKKGSEKKAYETDVMAPAFDKAFAKIKAMTFNDMVEAGLVDGISEKPKR